MNDNPIPQTYEEWRSFIINRCSIELSPKYVHERLVELQNTENAKTKAFVSRYGKAHLEKTISWFSRTENEMGK